MNKSILSAYGAFISTLCAIVLLSVFSRSGEALIAFIAVVFAFAVVAFIGYGIEDTKIADKLSNLFGEEVSHE